MRILWLCNICIPAVAEALGLPYSVREGWLTGTLDRLIEGGRPDWELGICFPTDHELEDFSKELPLRTMGRPQKEVLGPALSGRRPASDSAASGESDKKPWTARCYGFYEDLRTPERYESSMEERFKRILEDFRPDLVHIFGTEFPHALAMVRAFQKPDRTLVGIQGLCYACAEAYRADLPPEVCEKATFRDRLRHDSLPEQEEKFRARGEHEKEVLRSVGNITGRTRFDREGTAKVNPAARYYHMNETLRACFYEGAWSYDSCRKHSIFVSQGDYPLKGFHYVLQAMTEILQKFPDTVIRVAGNSIIGYSTWKEKIKISGYGNYLRRLLRKNGLEGRVEVMGSLNAEEMKAAYLQSHLYICPSALENSPNSLGEAMLLGVPAAASDTGGIPDMLEDGRSGLLFEKGNIHALAGAVIRIFESRECAERLSEGERERARRTHDPEENFRRLSEIYGEIVAR